MRISDWSSDVCSSDLRRLVVLRGLDRVLHHLLAVGDVVDGDHAHAGADAGVEGGAVPAHFADAAGPVEVDAERIDEAGAAASVLRLRLSVGVGFVAVDQHPAAGLDAAGQRRRAAETVAQDPRPVALPPTPEPSNPRVPGLG